MCYSPVCHFTHTPKGVISFDLHVLDAPPALVLSQDQTLHDLFIRLPSESCFIKSDTCTLLSFDVVPLLSYTRSAFNASHCMSGYY